MKPRRRINLSYESRVLLLSLAGGAPALLAAIILLWTGEHTAKVQWTVGSFAVVLWLGFAYAVRERVVRPLQTLSNLLAALREGDYSIRARFAGGDDALGLAFAEVNALGEPLREQRLGALEATTLLRRVMSEIDVAVFALDGEGRLRLVNRAGEKLLARPAERLLGRSAEELGLAETLEGEPRRIVEAVFPGSGGRWELRRSSFRQGGFPLELLVLTDLSRTLREEERQVWQRLVRVLSHEINNSLAPIKSIAGSLQALLTRQPRPPDVEEDLLAGLSVIAGRSEALNRFMASYARMARLPAPKLAPLDVETWVRRVADLEERLDVQVRPGPPATVRADGDQLDQLLINLVKNAVEASQETGGGVTVSWERSDSSVEVRVEDEGPGLPNTTNLFTPFFTTKRNGSGIGLVLSRQIAEAHGGTLGLENREFASGCVARLRLPV
ncbi:MAG TPA: ATP-binding protein [Gemmatimonadaceae bacterium]|nr:ATP-binding protein [Gemmatimonadaceae bacterium]